MSCLKDFFAKLNAILTLLSFKLSIFTNLRASSYPWYLVPWYSHCHLLHPLYITAVSLCEAAVPDSRALLQAAPNLRLVNVHLVGSVLCKLRSILIFLFAFFTIYFVFSCHFKSFVRITQSNFDSLSLASHSLVISKDFTGTCKIARTQNG